MSEENTFFLPVRDFYIRDLITCEHDDSVMEAAIVMRDRGISSLIACRDGQPVGIMTDRDLRSKVVAGGLDPKQLKVSEIMNAPVISVTEDDTLFEVLYRMSRHRIHRLGVVDGQNKLVGIINETDIMRVQNRTPQQLLRELDDAQNLEDIKRIHDGIEELVCFLNRSGVRTRDLLRLISLLHDQSLVRLIEVINRDRFPDLPTGFAFVVLGSEGRREQTLKTDQDNAIIYADSLSEGEIEQVREFSEALIAALIEIGVPECPGGIMAKNDFWRRSLGQWRNAVDSWVGNPSGENILNFGMLSDVRSLWGDAELVQQLKDHILRRTAESELFMARMAANVCRFVPPLGFFGGIKTEKSGEHAGMLDLKKAGIFALTEGIKTLALKAGSLEGSTQDKLYFLKGKGLLEAKQTADLDAAFSLLCFFRLRGQVEEVSAGEEPSNFIDPESLNRVEKGRLQIALEVVNSFENTLKSRFQLNLLG